MRFNANPSSPLSIVARKRQLLLGGAAVLFLASGTAAKAQSVTRLEEGQPTIQGDVELTNGNDALYLSLFRAGGDGSLNLGQIGTYSPLATGTVNTNGGADTLWLVADGTVSANLIKPPAGSKVAEFTGGIGYYLNAGADLTLNPSSLGASYQRELLLGGQSSGHVTINAGISVQNGRAISIAGTDDGPGLDVTLTSTVDGTVVPDGTAFVDAYNANSFTLAKNASIQVIRGFGLVASHNLTIIEDGAELRAKDSSYTANPNQNARLLQATDRSTVRNFGFIREQGDPFPVGDENDATISIGVQLGEGATLYNARTSATRAGQITMHGNAVVSGFGGSTIVNSGLIQSDMRSAIRSGGSGTDTMVVRNAVDGTIQGIALNAQNKLDHYTIAIEGGESSDVVVNAGAINGDVLLGGGPDAFLVARDASGAPQGSVNGQIDGGGDEFDSYGASFSTSGSYEASNGLLTGNPNITGFSRHGIEALGTDTVATFTSAETLDNGLTLFGNGTIVNRADISVSDQVGIAAQLSPYGGNTSNLLHFINERDASVETTNGTFAFQGLNSALASFENKGSFSSEDAIAAVYLNVSVPDATTFEFKNSGNIHAENGVGVLVGVTGSSDAGADLQIDNSGTISGSEAVAAYNDEGAIHLLNSGTLTGTFAGTYLRGASIDGSNNGVMTVTGTPTSSAALYLDAADISFENAGRIQAAGGAASELSAAIAINQNGGGTTTLVNDESGVIEASAIHSVAVAVTGNSSEFSLANRGHIIGSGTDSFDDEGILGAGGLYFGGLTTLASAIQTRNSIDTIVNDGAGLIVGNVDLDTEDDRFEARGTSLLQGDLSLGGGNDTLLLAGGAISGIAYGGAGMDTILIDLSADRTIVGEQFSSFETIKREGSGTGTLHASGTFDIDTLNLDGMTVMVDAGKTLTTQGATTITGSDNNERLIVEGTIAGSVDLGGGDDFLDLANGGTVTGTIDGGAGNDTIGFRLTANAGTEVIPDVLNFESLAVSGNYTLTLDKAFDSVTLREGADLVVTADAGTIANIYGDDTDQDVAVYGKLTGGVNLGGGNDTLALMDVSGVISGSIDGGEGQDKLILNLTGATEFGDGAKGFENIFVTGASPLTMNGTFGAGQLLTFGDDDNTLIIGAGAVFAGSVDGGAGNDTLTINTGAADTRTVLSGQIANFETLNANGPGWLSLTDGAFAFNDVTIDGGNLAIGANSSLTSASVAFTSGDNRLHLASGATITGAVDAGDGDDTLHLEQGANTVRNLSAIDGFETFEHLESEGAGELQVDADATFASIGLNGGLMSVLAGKTLTGPVTGGALAERIVLNGALVGNLNLGNGANALSMSSGSSLTGDVITGDDADTVIIGGTLTGNVDLGAGADSLSITAGGKLAGNVMLGAGDDTLSVLGSLDGNADLGDGNDRLILASLNSVTGTRTGGAGTDTLAFKTSGTYAAPTVYNGTGFDGFERLEVLGGVVSLTANTSWDDVDVVGGRLIGQAGTTLTSQGTIDVAKGATFGSAGTVNGNISVLGTLSPGASPGTMTVNGNVSFAAGSNLLIELTPTAGTDLLDVHGNLAIADGATIDITGALGNAPGTALDIVTANAITGRFTTVNKSTSVFGFVVQNDKKIQIRSEFASSDDYPTNVQSSIDYANDVLAGGFGVQAFTNALNVLTAADGTANQAAFGQLTPEAYGSALEMGKEASLQVVDATRQFHLTAPIEDGFYAFAQGTTGNSKLKSNRETGASSAKVEAGGLMGGAGYGFGGGRYQVGLFTGMSNTDLNLVELDARADGDMWHGGIYADARVGGLGIHGLFGYGESKVKMDRELLVSPTQSAHGNFTLKSWFADASVDYRVAVGGLDLTPRAGISYLKTTRSAVRETGAGDFSLAVDGASRDVWLGDVSLAASHTFAAGGARITPYGELGWRTRLGGEGTSVSGRFVGATGGAIVVDGIDRDKSAARFGLGLGAELSRNIRLQVGYSGDLGAAKQSTAAARATFRF